MTINIDIQTNYSEVDSKLGEVIADLYQLIDITEEKFAYLYESLPNCERDIKLIIREVELLLSFLLCSDESISHAEKSLIFDTLDKILNEFEQVTDTFLSDEIISVLSKTFLDNARGDNQNIIDLVKMFQEVEATLDILRDLAMNSIIYSVRIGNQGAAFQVLSDHINKTSLILGQYFETMETTINVLVDWNKDFKSALTDFIDYEDSLKSNFRDRFQNEFRKINKVFQAISKIYKSDLNNNMAVFTGVAEIMVMIQNQDIIRQNIENVIKCLQILKQQSKDLNLDDREKSLDFVVFANRTLEVSNLLIDNIEASLEESIFAVEQKLSGMHTALEELERDGFYITKLFSGSEANTTDSCLLKDTFNTVLADVEEIMDIKHQVNTKSAVLMDSGDRFYGLMESMERDFASINKESARLKRMKVLIKIELANIEMSKEMAANIVEAVEQVVETINSNQRMFLSLREYFLRNLKRFGSGLDIIKNRLEETTETIISSKAKLDTVQSLSRNTINVCGEEMKALASQLEEPLRHLSDTGLIKEIINNSKWRLAEIRANMEGIRQQLFAVFGVRDWVEKDDSLRLLLDQFTCFVERKAVAVVTGNSNEDVGSSGGDITLF